MTRPSRLFRWGVPLVAMTPLVLLAQPETRVLSHVPDLTIRTRSSIDRPRSTVTTSTVFLKGLRQRREQLLEFPQDVANGDTLHVTISQCDLRRTIHVNPQARLYAIVPATHPQQDVERRQRLLEQGRAEARRAPQPGEPEVVMRIEGVDTGERRTVGGRLARHIVTTTTTVPSAGATTRATERVEDGWYVDLPPPDCVERNPSATRVVAFGTVLRAEQPGDRLRVEQHGVVASGFPVQRVTRDSDKTLETSFTETTELIEVSHHELDVTLFDVPSGYQAAMPRMWGGFDLTKPDTFGNRFADYWDSVGSWARGVFARW